MYSKYMLKDVRFLLENENLIRNELKKTLEMIMKSIDMDISIREVFYILEYILNYGDDTYKEAILLPLTNRIAATQIKKENLFKIFFGKHSSLTGYNYLETDKEYLTANIGAFPTRISRGKIYIDGLYPDIDSTAFALIILSDTYKILRGKLKEKIIKTLEMGLDYLFKRDVNKDGLLEQAMNEDWAVGTCREGSVTYSNIIFYLAVEHLYDLFLSLGNREYIDKTDKKLTEAYDAILDKLWINNYLLNAIDKFGKYDLTYSLDTIYVSQSLILRKDDKIKIHMKTLADKLTVNGLLTVFHPPTFNECLVKTKEYNDVNAAVWPKYNIMFARALISMGYVTEAAKLLKNIFDIRNYTWVNPFDFSIHGPHSIENNALFLTALEEMKKKLETLDEERPASTSRE